MRVSFIITVEASTGRSSVSDWSTRWAHDAGLPPRVRADPACARDLYVAAAVQYAWAAESDYRLANPRAARRAENAAAALRHAAAFCVAAPADPVARCLTEAVWDCPAGSRRAPQPGLKHPAPKYSDPKHPDPKYPDSTPLMKSKP
ncbi:MAG TPA: hypothetical protein VGO89_19225 [Streptomyces sp.]|nr:hypothetical protein [Streptomyces sp.]